MFIFLCQSLYERGFCQSLRVDPLCLPYTFRGNYGDPKEWGS